MYCKTCGARTTQDEDALYKRLVNRGATETMCLSCLAQYFRCSEELLKQRIEFYKKIGCALFSPSEL